MGTLQHAAATTAQLRAGVGHGGAACLRCSSRAGSGDGCCLRGQPASSEFAGSGIGTGQALPQGVQGMGRTRSSIARPQAGLGRGCRSSSKIGKGGFRSSTRHRPGGGCKRPACAHQHRAPHRLALLTYNPLGMMRLLTSTPDTMCACIPFLVCLQASPCVCRPPAPCPVLLLRRLLPAVAPAGWHTLRLNIAQFAGVSVLGHCLMHSDSSCSGPV